MANESVPLIKDVTPVTRGELEAVCAGLITMQQRFLNLSAGLLAAIEEVRPEGVESTIIPKVKVLIDDMRKRLQ